MLAKYLRPAIALGCLLCAALAPERVLAFCRATSEEPADGCECSHEGMPSFWEVEAPIAYALNERGFPGVSDPALRGALARSFAHWTAVTCDGEPMALSLKQLAETTAETKEYLRSGPNLNVIAQLSAQDFLAARGDRHAFALTTTAVIKDTGEIIDADTVFNAGLGPFAVCPDQGCPDGTVDIENVATHEFGHFLGLAHSDDDEATMACSATRDELNKRSLEADDEAGICSIYAEPAIEERDEALHPRGVHTTGCGCRIDDTRGTGPSAALGSVTLAALLLSRRARASSRGR